MRKSEIIGKRKSKITQSTQETEQQMKASKSINLTWKKIEKGRFDKIFLEPRGNNWDLEIYFFINYERYEYEMAITHH